MVPLRGAVKDHAHPENLLVEKVFSNSSSGESRRIDLLIPEVTDSELAIVSVTLFIDGNRNFRPYQALT